LVIWVEIQNPAQTFVRDFCLKWKAILFENPSDSLDGFKLYQTYKLVKPGNLNYLRGTKTDNL
jgi:hypothetical protein